MEMTKRSEKALCLLYKEYLLSLESGEGSADSAEFSDNVRIEIFTEEEYYDIDYAIEGLKAVGAIKYDVNGTITMTNTAIAHMEHKFKRNFGELTDLLANFNS